MSEPLLPAVAKAIAEWFPELGGRAIAVSEADITRENMPTLPVAFIALARETADHAWKGANGKMAITSEFVIEFLFKTEKYKLSDGSESPFWAFYDYGAIRDKLWTEFVAWRGPGGEAIEYVSMDIDADPFSVNVAFVCRAHFNWCPDEKPAPKCAPDIRQDGDPILPGTIAQSICAPKQLYCGPAFDPPPDCDPCSSE